MSRAVWAVVIGLAADAAIVNWPGKVAAAEFASSSSFSTSEISAVVSPAGGAKLTFRRVFKSSSPEFIEIVVPEDSSPATYDIRQLDEEPRASPFEISAGLRSAHVRIGGQLNNFQGRIWMCTARSRTLAKKLFAGKRARRSRSEIQLHIKFRGGAAAADF